MQVFFINANSGDGSSYTEFYESKACIDFLTNEHTTPDFERYIDGDGGSWGSFTVPDGTPITGIEIGTLAELQKGEE